MAGDDGKLARERFLCLTFGLLAKCTNLLEPEGKAGHGDMTVIGRAPPELSRLGSSGSACHPLACLESCSACAEQALDVQAPLVAVQQHEPSLREVPSVDEQIHRIVCCPVELHYSARR